MFLKEDDLKEILVDTEAKGIKTQKEGDKKKNNSRKYCHTSIIASILVLEVSYPNQQKKNKQHVNVY